MINTGLNNSDIERIENVFALYLQVEKVIFLWLTRQETYKFVSDIDVTLVGSNLNVSIQQKIEKLLKADKYCH